MDSNLELIGTRIRLYRNAKNWTQAQLAEQVQSTASYIGQIERGEINSLRNIGENFNRFGNQSVLLV